MLGDMSLLHQLQSLFRHRFIRMLLPLLRRQRCPIGTATNTAAAAAAAAAASFILLLAVLVLRWSFRGEQAHHASQTSHTAPLMLLLLDG
jgi:hypothetical protein